MSCVCKYFAVGKCQRGAACTFSHRVDEKNHTASATMRTTAVTYVSVDATDARPSATIPATINASVSAIALSATAATLPVCKYFAAGFCNRSPQCESSHDVQAISDVVQTWMKESMTEFSVPVVSNSSQPLDYAVVLDFEGAQEVIEMPVLILDMKNGATEVARFHRWIRPVTLFDMQQKEASDRHRESSVNKQSDAVSFVHAMDDLHQFLWKHQILRKKVWSFVCCGDWDIKTQVPKQCGISRCTRPHYFDRWCNVKQVYNTNSLSRLEKKDASLETVDVKSASTSSVSAVSMLDEKSRSVAGRFGDTPVTGMTGLLKRLHLPLVGTHHLGMHDVSNIVRCIRSMVQMGLPIDVTDRRKPCRAPRCTFGGACTYAHPGVSRPMPIDQSANLDRKADLMVAIDSNVRGSLRGRLGVHGHDTPTNGPTNSTVVHVKRKFEPYLFRGARGRGRGRGQRHGRGGLGGRERLDGVAVAASISEPTTVAVSGTTATTSTTSTTSPSQPFDHTAVGTTAGMASSATTVAASKTDNSAQCAFCLSQPSDHVILPCMHLCLCGECVDQIKTQSTLCLMCRAPFTDIKRIFSS